MPTERRAVTFFVAPAALRGDPESVSEKGTGTFCSADTAMGKANPTPAPQNEPVPDAFRIAS
jgi:hypothetical protein